MVRRHTKNALTRYVALLALVFLSPVNLVLADGLRQPEGDVILTIEGRIRQTNAPGRAEFDASMLKELGWTEVTTETPWTDGMARFSGPALQAVLDLVGAEGTQLFASAINDYSVVIPMEDARNYAVILAQQVNGEDLSLRDRGPLWVIYPWSDNSEIQTDAFISRSIWMLKNLKVE